MTSLEMALRLLISRLERKLWDDATATDIAAPNGDIIGSAVKGYHHVNNGHVKYTLKDYERGVAIYPSFSIMMMDGDWLALFIKVIFKTEAAGSMIHELEIASIMINGNNIRLDEIDSDDNSKKAENMIMSLIINL